MALPNCPLPSLTAHCPPGLQSEMASKASRVSSGGVGGGGSSSSGRLDHWLQPGIVVKVMSKELKEHGYYRQKVG